MAEWPARNQQAPNFWDQQLRDYIDEGDASSGGTLTVVNGGIVALEPAAEGTLRGFRVKADTTFTFDGQETLLTPGAYSLERTPLGWLIYKAANGYLLGTEPDTTPASPVTGLVVTGGEGQISANWADSTDPESDVSYGYRVWLTSAGSSGDWIETTTSDFTMTDLAPGGYTVQVYATSAGGPSAIVSGTGTVVPVPGWNLYDSLTATEIGADGDKGSTYDFTTSGGRTWRASSAYGGQVSVLGGYVRGPRDNGTTSGGLVAGRPLGDVALSWDYNNVGDAGDGYLSATRTSFDQLTGGAVVNVEKDWAGDGALRLVIGPTYGTEPVCTAGPSKTLRADGKSVLMPPAGRLRLARQGQIISVYLNGELMMSADFTTCTYGGSPNTLAVDGSFREIQMNNTAGASNIEWEVYS